MSDLIRFHRAQEEMYDTALREIRSGRKRSHWIWYVFPQIAGLGMSGMSQYYAIRDLDEAREYLADKVLRDRLVEISGALLELDTGDARAVMGFPDDMKLRSCMTLFSEADPGETVFTDVLGKFFGGEKDGLTLEKLGRGSR